MKFCIDIDTTGCSNSVERWRLLELAAKELGNAYNEAKEELNTIKEDIFND